MFKVEPAPSGGAQKILNSEFLLTSIVCTCDSLLISVKHFVRDRSLFMVRGGGKSWGGGSKNHVRLSGPRNILFTRPVGLEKFSRKMSFSSGPLECTSTGSRIPGWACI